jgi:hypothetical protein
MVALLLRKYKCPYEPVGTLYLELINEVYKFKKVP